MKNNLALNSKTISYIAIMARELLTKEQVSIPNKSLSSTSDLAMQVLTEH